MKINENFCKEKIIKEYGTPCAVIDLDIVERNIQRAQKLCDENGLDNRPHIKTHKSPILAQMQIKAGAKGVTCQKIGEAEVMAETGINDIIIATNVLGAARSGRLSALLKTTSLKACADNLITLKAYSAAAEVVGRSLEVMIECDTGQKRAGVETPEEAIILAKIIRDDPNLKFAGLLFYPPLEGWVWTQVFFDKVKLGLASLGMHAKIVSTGGTPNFAHIGEFKGATEHRAGTCIFNDRMMIKAGFASLNECGFHVHASVVSRAGPTRGILDSGSKTLTSDRFGLTGYGHILEYPEAIISKFAEEHGFLDLTRCNEKPNVGDVVRIIPNHVCVCVNMFDEMIAIRGREIVDLIPISARGKLI